MVLLVSLQVAELRELVPIGNRDQRALDYSCRVDTHRRVVLSADYDLQAAAPSPRPTPPAPRPMPQLPVGPVDARGATAVCKQVLADRITAERGQDKEINWGMVATYAAQVPHQIRVAGRGGTFVGRKRDRTFNIECMVDLRTGQVISASHDYD